MKPSQTRGRGRAGLQRGQEDGNGNAANRTRSRGPSNRQNVPWGKRDNGDNNGQQTPQEGPTTLVAPTTQQFEAGKVARGAIRGNRVLFDIIETRSPNLQTKRGKSGEVITLEANYFRIRKQPLWNVHQYRVDFAPEIELMKVRKALLREHNNILRGYIFDGCMLFTFHELSTTDSIELVSKNLEGEPVQLLLKKVGILKTTEGQYLQILNLILRRSMEGLKLQLVGRNFFDGIAKIPLRNYKLELWPGYVTSIRQHETDIMVCVEIAHKVMRMETIYDILKKSIQESRNYQEAFKKQVVGMVVLTDYNNQTYRIDDVNFTMTPSSKFSTKEGEISFVEYYRKRYNINIKDVGQPLLVSIPSDKRMRGEGQNNIILLIPELARATGLTEDMKNNFQMMRALSEHTRLVPNIRVDRLNKFNRRLVSTPDSVKVLDMWDLKLDQNLVQLKGRVLNPEKILLGRKLQPSAGKEADWSREFRSCHMYVAKDLNKWACISTSRNQNDSTDFVKSLKEVARGMGMRYADPDYIILNDDRNGTYVAAIEKACNKDCQLIMTVIPNINGERYSCIKKKCYVDRSMPSQVIVHRTIAPKAGKPSGLKSVATKVAIQMNAKLTGTPWMVYLPITGLMTIGFDVCHSTRNASKSFGALVATMDLNVSSTHFSTVSEHNKGQELSNEISLNVAKALKCYREVHGSLPKRILFYRDGVSDGQLHQVTQTEVSVLIEKLKDIYLKAKADLMFSFVIVTKRINTRFFHNRNNPAPGTVVDDVVTLPERYDFYLVSQSVRQGTVSPTSYNIIHDSLGLDPDKMQMLTYKMCHLYYNWCGTTRVPAVCQYAHKLAFLVSQSINQAPSNHMEKQLYFL